MDIYFKLKLFKKVLIYKFLLKIEIELISEIFLESSWGHFVTYLIYLIGKINAYYIDENNNNIN